MVTNDSAVVIHPEKNNFLPPPEPFYVVLVDIKQTVDTRHIQCTKVPLESETDLKFVAISYRWGELLEQIVPTIDYNAHITSFDINDFILLCEMISEEPELGQMQYVWVDAICVDQMNETRKKETIYRMNDIYDQANYILAVPDLHLAYLKKNPSNCERIESMQQNALLLYHIIQQNYAELHALDDKTLKEWEVPEENRADMAKYVVDFKPDDVECDYLRKPLGITSAHYAAFWEAYSTWAPDKIVSDIFATKKEECREEKGDHSRGSSTVSASLYDRIKRPIQKLRSVFSTSSTSSSKPLSHQARQEPSNLTVVGGEQDSDQYHLQQLIIMMQVNKWNIRLKERNAMVRNVLDFFKYLINDWSDRVWVISEYHISKKKEKLMLWFISFSEYEEDTFEGHSFIQVRFPSSGGNPPLEEDIHSDAKDEELKEKKKLAYASTRHMVKQGIDFSNHIKSALIDRHFLELMLRSKASRNQDRFNAVLPISDAHHLYLKDKDTISQWAISNMVSVRMRVRTWFTAEENLTLLYSLWSRACQQITLPSFDHEDIDSVLNNPWQHFSHDRLFEIPTDKYNFDLQQPANVSSSTTCTSVSIVDEADTAANPSLLRYSIHIQPKQYQIQKIYYLETDEPFISFISTITWRTLQLNPYRDALFYVQIPLLHLESAEQGKEMEEEYKWSHRIALVGSMEKNMWVTVGRNFIYGDLYAPYRQDSHHTEGELIMQENTDGLRFHIY